MTYTLIAALCISILMLIGELRLQWLLSRQRRWVSIDRGQR